jgi:hypothetical protein
MGAPTLHVFGWFHAKEGFQTRHLYTGAALSTNFANQQRSIPGFDGAARKAYLRADATVANP